MVALQSQYTPRSRGTGIDTVTPTNMTTALALSLDRVEQVTGLNVDTYVATKLGIDRETLHDRYAAEQIDTLAITYLNLERGKVTLIGNDTGTGKGRIVCGLIQSVIAPIALPDISRLSESEKEQAIAQIIETAQTASQNQQIAVFLTAKPELYVDMLGRDMVDTGIKDRIRPFFTNAGLDLELKAPDGRTLGFIRTGGSAERSREMRRLINEFHKTGTIGDYNVVFTTYDQLKEKGSIRRQFIEAIAPVATFILDECDLGGGASGPQPELNASQKRQQAAGGDIRSTSGFLTEVVLPNSRNYALLSATAFKDPYVLARLLYPKSEIQQTGLSAEALASTLVRQGTPAQQDFTSKLAMAGELVRLEKSIEGVEFTNTLVTVNLTKFQQSIEVMRLIVEFDRAKRLAVHTLEEAAYVRAERVKAVDASAGEASVTSTLFSSTAYNFAQQLLFALSSESIANKAISEIEAGRKPIVGFYNTMQSALEFYLDAQYDEIFEAIKADYREQHFDLIRVEHPDVAPDIWEEIFQSQYLGAIVAAAKREYQAWIATNPEIGLNVGDLLLRQLEKCRWVTIGDAYGEKSRYRMTDDELGVGAIEIVNQIQRRVEALDWSGIPISPIDDILHRIAQRGYSIAEMSGRNLGLDYSSGTPRLKTVNASDVQVRTDAKAAFNNGTSDALITNITTGWSAHASRTFQDQRQRVLIVGQAHPDVNKFVQFLGRANRTGQLNPAKHSPDQIESGRPTWGRVTERYDIPGAFGLPRSELIIAEGIPYVQRIVSEINRKMDSLNANTTGNRQSAQSFDGPSFSNSAGDTVAAQLLKDDDELNQALDYPLVNSETNDGAAKKVTGRAIFLPLEEQGRLFATLTERFNAYITQQEALGESPLEQKTLNLEARTQERLELIEAQSTSHLFGGAVTVERMLIKALRKPYSSEQIRDEIRSRLNLDDMPVQPDDFAAGSALREAAGEQVATRLDDADERVTQQLQDYEQKLDQLAQRLLPKAGLLRDRTQLDSDIKALSEQKDEPVDKAVNQEIKQKQAELKKVESKLKKLEKIEQDQATLRSRKQDIETRWKSVRALISDYSPGQSVSIRTSNGAMLGIMLDCQRNEGVKSPVAGSAWKLTIAVVDSSRELTLTIGDVLPPFGRITLQSMDFGLRTDPNTGDIELLPVPALFDRAQSETHELREMLTGNLLNAKNGGKYVSFTTAQGVVRQGILLPRESNVEKELASAPIVVANFAQARQLISEGAVLRTPDNLTLQKTSRIMDDNTRRAGVEVAVSASRRGGGHYYTDVELLKCTLNREGKPGFAKHSDKMKAFVPDENLEAFVKLLSQTGTPLQVTQTAFKARAREVTGQELKTFAAISNDDLGMAEFQIPVEQIRAEIEQHRLKNSTLIAESIDEIDDERSDIDVLIDAYQQHFANGSQFQDVRQARQFGIEQLEQLGRSTNFLDRTIEECIEGGIVQQAKQLVGSHRANPLAAFDALVELYERQPNLSARTSDSILLQQYSTPVPLGLLVQELAQIQMARTVWEPTAGNGALLTATTRSTQVLANEIDSSRAERLRSQGYEVTERDATEFRLPTQVDVVVANPPFGKSDDHTGSPKQWEVDLGNNPAPGTRAYPTTQMDHAIAFKSLSAMNDRGRAVLVLGAPMDQKVGRNPSKAYNGSDKRAFFFTLYNNYNVTQHFTVSGDLYGKQGTSFPVDVVVIEGRGKSALPLPAAQNPPVYREWAQLRAVLAKALERNGTIAAPQATRSANIESEIAPSDITAPEQESEQLDNLESNPGEENEAATSSPRRSSRSQPNNPTSIDLPVPTVSESTAIEPPESLQIPREQLSLLEKQAARFLYDSGIAEAILEGDQFKLGVDHETYQPLAIQCQENRLSFTRCREIDGDFILDSEAVFQIEPTGHLRFVEVASPLPTGQVVRSPDRAFAMSLIRALYDGGFVEATQAAYERSRPESIALRLANSIRSLLGRDLNTVLSRQVEIDGLDYVFESGRLLVPGSRRFYEFISVIVVSESLARPVFSVEDMDNQPSATVFDQTHLRRLRTEIESENFVVFLPGEPDARTMTIEELVDNSAVLGANRLNELSIVNQAVIQSVETASAGEMREIAAEVLGYSTGVKQDATVTDPVAEVTSIVLEDNTLEALRKIEALPFPLNHYLEEKIATPDVIVLIQNPALGCYECFGEIATSVARLTGGQLRTMGVEDLEVPFSRFSKSRLDQVVEQLQFQQEVVVVHSKHDRDTFPIVLLAPEEMPLLSVDQPTLRYEGGIVVFNREEIAAIAETFAQQHQYSRAELRDNLSRIVSTALPAQQIEAAVTALLDDDCRATQFSQSSLNVSTPSAEQQEWEAFVQANTKTYGRGEKTAIERFAQIQARIKQTLTLPETLDRKAVKLSLQALKEAVATKQGQQVLRTLTTGENAHVDGSTLASLLVQEASEIRRSYVEAKINAIEPLLQDLQARYSEYRFHRSNWAKTEGEVYPYINICDTADQRVASIYFVEATPKSIENAEAKLQEHRATVVQSTPQRECDKVSAAAIDQIRQHLDRLAEIVTCIEVAQQNDQQMNGNGRYEFEAAGGQQREQIDHTIAIATVTFDQFRNLAPTRNIDADRVFAELGGIPTVPALSELAQAWAQQHSHAHETPLVLQTFTPGYATLETEWGVLTATVTLRDDDFLQVEVIGSTANWHEYPSEAYIGYVSIDEWCDMGADFSNPNTFAQFAIEDRHTQFLHQLNQERDRLQTSLERWLNRQPEIELESVLASDQAREALIDRFQSVYPERDRVELTVELRRLAILSILAPDRLVEFMQSASLSTASDLEPQITPSMSVEDSIKAAQPDEQQLTLLSLDQWVTTNQSTDWDDPATLPTPVNEETTLAQNSEIQSSVLSPANLKESTNPTEETGPQGTGRSFEELHSAIQGTVEIEQQITLPDVAELTEVQSTLPPATQTVPASQVAIETISAINPEAANQLAPMLQAYDSSPTLDQMRQWWRQALEIGRPPEHLQKIKEVGIAVKTGTGQATTEDLSQMQRDQQKWQQVKTLVDQAHRFLDQIGKDEFQKDNYRIQRSDNQLTITDIKEGRGDIVRLNGETLRSKVMKKDVERFATVDKLVQKLHRTTASAAIAEHSS